MISTGEEGIRRGKMNVKVIEIKIATARKSSFLYMNNAKGLLNFAVIPFKLITLINNENDSV
jgi:hypothetical protein